MEYPELVELLKTYLHEQHELLVSSEKRIDKTNEMISALSSTSGNLLHAINFNSEQVNNYLQESHTTKTILNEQIGCMNEQIAKKDDQIMELIKANIKLQEDGRHAIDAYERHIKSLANIIEHLSNIKHPNVEINQSQK